LALSSREAKEMIELAEQRRLVLCVGLHLLAAPFLQDFLRAWTGRRIRSMDVEWLDPAVEERHGEVKSANLATHKADEVVPHLWSVLTSMVPGHEPELRSVTRRHAPHLCARAGRCDDRAHAKCTRTASNTTRRRDSAYGPTDLEFRHREEKPSWVCRAF
jgi:predicted dehydrogenase